MWAKFATGFWPLMVTTFWMLIYIASAVSILAWLYSRLEILFYRTTAPHTVPAYERNSAKMGIMLTWLGIAGFLVVFALVWYIFGSANFIRELGNVIAGTTSTHDMLLVIKTCAAVVFVVGMWMYLTAEVRPHQT